MEYKFFTNEELKCKCGACSSSGDEMSDEFMRKIETLRVLLGFPFIVTSAYRCPAYNYDISNTGYNGPHTTGKAIDILVYGENAYNLMANSLLYRFNGIGVKQKGKLSSRFIHLDMTHRRTTNYTVWTY